MNWRRLLSPWRMIRCRRCPSCEAVVIPNRTTVKDATFAGDVYMGASVTLVGARFDASKVEVAGDALITGGTFNDGVVMNVGGQVTLKSCTLNNTGARSTGNRPVLTLKGSLPSLGTPVVFATPPPPLPKPPAPDLELTFGTDVLVAWRAWRLITFERRGGVTETRLAPYAGSAPWLPRERVEATCTASGTHEAPWLDCTCGIWAVHTRDAAKALACDVLGSVSLWGRVLEFERGYRAQFAYPKQLFVGDEETAEELARVYGVPVEVAA